MRSWSTVLLIALTAVSCGSATPEASPELCDLALRVDAVFAQFEADRELTPMESAQVQALVDEMTPLVPDELDATFRLRYWPNTSVAGLDTSGVAAQEAFEDWRVFRSASC